MAEDPVALHSRQAAEFEARYQRLREAPYTSTFTYGRKKIGELMDEVVRGLPGGARALDVGCGVGYDLRRMRERGLDAVGVEPSAEMRARAREANPGVEIVAGDVERLPFGDARFDFVCAIEVLRYLREPERAARELARVLRPGGVAFVTAAPRWSLSGYALINQLTGRVKLPSFHHVRQTFLSAAQARALFRRAGFSVVDTHGVFLGPWQAVGRLSGTLLSKLLRAYEPLDDWLSDRPLVRDLANHLVILARR